jgi:hypothetical protein
MRSQGSAAQVAAVGDAQQRRGGGDAAQVYEALERSGELADRRPCAADDDGAWHDKTCWRARRTVNQVGLISIRG